MIIRRRFRPLGKVMQRFGRVHINNYSTESNTASRAELPPDWQEFAEVPLNWPEDEATDFADAVQAPASDFIPPRRPRAERPSAPAAPVQRRAAPPPAQPAAAPTDLPAGVPQMPVRSQTPPDLAALLARHRAQVGDEPPTPSPFAPANRTEPSRARTFDSSPNVQRRSAAPASDNVTTPPPPEVTGRRRGRVIEEITPTAEGESPVMSAPAEPDELAETVVQAAPPPASEDNEDRPDLYEALMSEGIVSPPTPPDFADAEVFSRPVGQPGPGDSGPTVQRSTEPPPPIVSRASTRRPPQAQRQAAESPAQPAPPVQRDSQPPVSDAPPPVQRAAAPEGDFFSEDELEDILQSYTPEPDSVEADMLDILGLPADMPVVGYRPANRPPAEQTPDNPPAAPGRAQAATPPPVQRSEASAASTTSSTADTQPIRRIREQAQPPEPSESPAQSQPDDDIYDVFSAPTEIPVMRQMDDDAPPVMETFEDDSLLPPAAENFTSFFEAAETTLLHDDSVPEASAPPPRPNAPPARDTVQRAPADAPDGFFDDAPEQFDDYEAFEDTQPSEPVNLPPRHAAPPQTPQRRIQRSSTPPSESSYGDLPLPDDEAYDDLYDESWAMDTEFDGVDDFTPASERPPSAPTPGQPPQPIQRTPDSGPSTTPPRAPDAGYRIEGAESLNISRAAPRQLSRLEGKTDTGFDGQQKTGSSIVPSGVPSAGKLGDSFPGKFSDVPASNANSGSGPVTKSTTSSPPAFESLGTGKAGVDFGTQSQPANTSSSSEAPSADTSQATSEGGSGAEEGNESDQQGNGPNLDKLARDVYSVLRERLRIEQERRSRR